MALNLIEKVAAASNTTSSQKRKRSESSEDDKRKRGWQEGRLLDPLAPLGPLCPLGSSPPWEQQIILWLQQQQQLVDPSKGQRFKSRQRGC
jgi:hypothetical protein